jgi:hypothetical protein
MVEVKKDNVSFLQFFFVLSVNELCAILYALCIFIHNPLYHNTTDFVTTVDPPPHQLVVMEITHKAGT